MYSRRYVHGLTVSLAVLSLVVPQFVSASSPREDRPSGKELVPQTSKAEKSIADVALDAGGTLRGQVVNANGIAEGGIRVRLAKGAREVGTATTDTNGNFAIVAGGVYQVGTENSATAVRGWTNRAAPPDARNSILVVDQTGVARGSGILDGSALGLVVIGGVVATTVAVAVTASNDFSS